MVIDARAHAQVDGLTVSGGEPFDQAAALEEFIVLIREFWPDGDILVYSGYSLSRLQSRYSRLLGLIDALISEPYVEGRETERRWMGSSNQKLTLLSARAFELYRRDSSADGPRLQVGIDDHSIWIAGIPRRGDLQRLQESLQDRGLVFGEVSWNR